MCVADCVVVPPARLLQHKLGGGGSCFFEILNLVLKVCFVSIVTHDMCGMTGMDSAPNVLEIDAGPPAI